MRFDMQLMGPVVLALLTALVVSFLMTPVVKSFAYKVGAIVGCTTSRFPGWVGLPSLQALW